MKIRTTRNTVVAAVVFLTLSGVSAISNATISAGEYESVRVNYSDLNLDQKEGREALYTRLRRAAGDVCDAEYSRLEERECFDTALDRAVEEVGNQELTAIHRS